ncbi:hypothetical protein PHMEG_00022870 [Phytophthora megakarya]|uniref:Uncharacterized protein n=1 Tax=Phytophthora megakarya TaxID=4795 RepID=A0A225VJ18_9STRA|nr:hypothetical protein PHMEG_00022870 [Phytophthora megakarya]
MSDVPTSPCSSTALPGSERADYRGKCLYKTGKCMNERALKTSGTAHNLCDEHRNRQNQHQRKLDAKNRLHKRDRRVSSGPKPKSERFAPYPAVKLQAVGTADEEDSVDTAAAAGAVPAVAIAASSAEETPSSSSHPPVLATASSGVMFLPNGPQPPQVSYPFMMQDFDGIVVPLPSYLEGQERIEFRSRIYQKVLDFISEECILRFGAKVEAATGLTVPGTSVTTPQASSGLQTEHQTNSDDSVSATDEDLGDDISDVQSSTSVTESRTTKKVH